MSNLTSEAVALMREEISQDPAFVRALAEMAGIPSQEDLAAAMARETSQEAQLTANDAAISAEAQTREETDESLQGQINTLSSGKVSTTDPRLSDARAPTAHTHGWSDVHDVPDATTTAKGVTWFSGDGGATAGRAVQANDTRLSNARTPTAHVHPISEVTGLQTALNGKEPTIAAGLTAQFYRGDKTWQVLNYLAVAGLSTVANTGAYNDLSGKPALFSGAYSDLTGKPSLFSGVYADLTGKPALFSGSYTDLTNKPALGTAAALNTGTTAGTVATGNHTHSDATTSVSGFMSAADKTLLGTLKTVQRIRATTDANGLYTWTYPTAYAAGVVPVVMVVAESSSDTNYNYNAHIQTAATNTAVTVKTSKVSATTLSLVGLLNLLISAPAANCKVDIYVIEP